MQLNKIDFSSYKTILVAAVIIRLIAAIFSQGYGMHDDHFLVIEASASWAHGYDYNHWLPWSPLSDGKPEGHSFTYVGLNYFYFVLMKAIGIVDPKVLMLINRLVHAAFSLLIVHFGFKITQKLGSRELAVKVGWILALLWVLPFLSVRNLVEIVCIPFIMWGIWLVIKGDKYSRFLLAGLILGMAVSIRYQVAVFAVGMALVYLFQKEFKGFLLFALGGLLMFSLTQGLVDYLIWGYPFAEFLGYALYNVNEGTEYIPNNNYFMYILVLMGLVLFPLGLLLGIGFFKSWKKYVVLFFPVICFVIFHSFYPSKQERFILPVLPFFIILGVLGYQLIKQTDFWLKFWNGSWKAFWILNIPLLIFASFTYSKKSRVESMYFFYSINTEKARILHEATGESDPSLLPKFYSGNWTLSGVARGDKNMPPLVYPDYDYDYVLFCGEENLSARIDEYRLIYPAIHLVQVCEPSFVDSFLRWLNPRNANEYIEIWKTNVNRDGIE
jgi:hypothetical protein